MKGTPVIKRFQTSILRQFTQVRDGRSSWLGLPAAANVPRRLEAPVTEKGKRV
jgi:hypothetical protein